MLASLASLALLLREVYPALFPPYALLAFALQNVLRITFVASAIGANLVWIIALYASWMLSVNHGLLPLNSAPVPGP
jgi:hypothetical protein